MQTESLIRKSKDSWEKNLFFNAMMRNFGKRIIRVTSLRVIQQSKTMQLNKNKAIIQIVKAEIGKRLVINT